jgi:hypothetical protein
MVVAPTVGVAGAEAVGAALGVMVGVDTAAVAVSAGVAVAAGVDPQAPARKAIAAVATANLAPRLAMCVTSCGIEVQECAMPCCRGNA